MAQQPSEPSDPSAQLDLSLRTGVAYPDESSSASTDSFSLSSADSAAGLALRHHPRTRALFAEAAFARAERSGQRVLPNPEADFALRKNGDESHWELEIMGDVNGLLLYPWRRGTGNLHYQSALSRLASEQSEQKAEVKKAWYHAVAAAQTQGLVAQTSAIWDAAAVLARRQRDAGTMNTLDLAEVGAAAAEARLNLRAAEANTVEERENLSRVLGVASSRVILPESLPEVAGGEPSLTTLESMAATRNAGLVAAREEAKTLEKSYTLSRLEVLPSLKAGVSIESDDAGRRAIGPAIAAEIPIFDLGIPGRARARAARDAGRHRLAAAELELRPEIRRHYHAMVMARLNHEEIVKTLLPLRELATAETLKQYNFMLTGVYRLLSTRRENLASHKMAVESLRDYWTARAELERLIGGPLPSSAIKPPETSSHPSGNSESTDLHNHGDHE